MVELPVKSNHVKIRIGDIFLMIKKHVATDIARMIKPYQSTAVPAEEPEKGIPVQYVPSPPICIYLCPECKQHFLTAIEFSNHLTVDPETKEVTHEKIGFSSQGKALKAYFAD